MEDRAKLSLSPISLDFGDQPIGTTSPPQTVTLTNTGSATLNIAAITLVGANAADFSFDSAVTTCPLGGGSLAAGGSCALGVVFSPSEVGARLAQINVADDAVGSPPAVPLTGVGTLAAQR